ncbi:MAG: acetylglutamate kinase [Phycisphaerales bacterium]
MNPLVIKLSGRILHGSVQAQPLWDAIAFAVKHSPVVIVHGGGNQVDALLQKLGEETERVDGIRVTPESQIDYITGVLAGQISLQIVGGLKAAGVAGVGVSLGDSGMLRCCQTNAKLGRVGTAVPGETPLLSTLIKAGYVPVVNSIGLDDQGAFLNVNADDAAAAIAISTHASELVYVTDVVGLMDSNDSVVTSVASDQVEHLIASGIATDGMAAKLRSASDAIEGGVQDVHITDSAGAMNRLMGRSCVSTVIHHAGAVTS